MNECVNGQELWCFLSDYVLRDPREDDWRSVIGAVKVFADCWLGGDAEVIASYRSLLVRHENATVFKLTLLEKPVDDDYSLIIWSQDNQFDFFRPPWH